MKMYASDAFMSDYRAMGNTAAQQRSDLGSFQGMLKGPDHSRMSKKKKWSKREEQKDLLSSLIVSALGRCTQKIWSRR